MKILITGHKGLIGTELWKALEDKTELSGYDYKDEVSLDTLTKNKYDLIIHCAANCVIREVIQNPEYMLKNIEITYDVMEKARKNNSKVLLLSSGRLNANNKNPYTVSKSFLEEMASAYKECYNINSVIVRPECVWGRENENRVRVIPHWIDSIKENKDVVVYGDLEKTLTPVHVTDFVQKGLLPIIEDFERFQNLEPLTVTGPEMKVYNIITTMKDVYKSSSNIQWCAAELSQPQNNVERKNLLVIDDMFRERICEDKEK